MFYVGEGELYSNYIAEGALGAQDMEAWLADLTKDFTAERGFAFRFVG